MKKSIKEEISEHEKKTWHAKHKHTLSFSDRIADSVANTIGSWKFIISQTSFLILWIAINIVAYERHWDPYPFILLNLVLAAQAAYAAPIIMMAQNRQSERDRHQALEDYETNTKAKKEIEALQKHLTTIEDEKLDKILEILLEIRNSRS